MQFHVGGHEQIYELSISRSAGSAAINIGGDVVDFLAVLLDDNRSPSGSGIGSQDHPTIVLHSYNCGSGLLMGNGLDDFLFDQQLVPTIACSLTFDSVTDQSLPFVRCMIEDVPFSKIF